MASVRVTDRCSSIGEGERRGAERERIAARRCRQDRKDDPAERPFRSLPVTRSLGVSGLGPRAIRRLTRFPGTEPTAGMGLRNRPIAVLVDLAVVLFALVSPIRVTASPGVNAGASTAGGIPARCWIAVSRRVRVLVSDSVRARTAGELIVVATLVSIPPDPEALEPRFCRRWLHGVERIRKRRRSVFYLTKVTFDSTPISVTRCPRSAPESLQRGSAVVGVIDE
ncbi:hypothetical protein SAMN05216218_105277 [Halorientalis regularis]|uniref:Uncharacterized protein n=1 Tax=Halorientalis regularis TaxID=660518 RepID=A0A1G7KFH8_9EURY|nr:hypothetical protein SAMN05216218_105277 [Halorientalis regularis]